jgi:hypothetical protein
MWDELLICMAAIGTSVEFAAWIWLSTKLSDNR